MNRKTYYEDGRWHICDGAVVFPIPRNNPVLYEAVEKLAAYENTGLLPEEIVSLREGETK